MVLTEKDYENIAAKISEGSNSIDYDKGDETLHIDCVFETEGSWEDDFYNGTGAYIELYRRFFVEKARVYAEDGIPKPIEIDEAKLEKLIA